MKKILNLLAKLIRFISRNLLDNWYYLSAKEACLVSGYSRSRICTLCRTKKIKAEKFYDRGISFYLINKASLLNYLEEHQK